MMNAREQRGRELAQVAKNSIRRRGRAWQVPSQSRPGHYMVDVESEPATCSCPDYETHGSHCKHIFAVYYSIVSETAPDGTVTETRSVRVTYSQDWRSYNEAQTHERERFEELLRALCAGIPQPPQGRGRPRLPLADVVFSAAMKVYSTVSGRRAMSEIRECKVKGSIEAAPHYNSVFRYLDNPSLTPILKALIEESAIPLRAVESDFAVDSSGFSACGYVRWFDEKYGRERKEHRWVKCHLMVGVKTNVVTSVEMTGGAAADAPHFAPLLASTAKRFQISEVSADKGYLSNANLVAVEAIGARPFIPFKVHTRTEGRPETWQRLWHLYNFNRAEFLAHYHKRSNVETTFSMIKAKFGASVRSKRPVAQANEVYLKVLCHNLCCLVQSMYELGIEPTFWQ